MPSTPLPQPRQPVQQASSRLLLLMAIACGLCAGCNYINQPLLHSIAHSLQVTEAQAAYSVTISQLSYAGGLLLLVPLGDLLDRRGLVVGLMVLAAAGLLLCAVTGQIALFWFGSAIAGVFSVAAQVLVPMVTLLVAPQQAGRAVGILMTGLLIGIQSARSVAGILSGTAGWQSVYTLTAVLMLLVAAALWKLLPTPAALGAAAATGRTGYGAAMRSMGQLLVAEPRLRSRTLMGAFSFASLSVLFSTMALLLGKAPHHLSDMGIGLISLVGVASALVAKPVGQRADRGQEPATSLAFGLVLVAIWPLMWLSTRSITAFGVGLLVLGVCIAAIHISNQSVIFRLAAASRSRANALYMTGYFLGASAGSALGVVAWDAGGWPAVCWLGLLLALGALAATGYDRRLARQQPAMG
ncbi:MFS transporter [Corticibacter populi]|uniref:MFS transporter n=1 Tax=Corticibacter populi TaxID=1550736 RepID=A0A3M6QMH6_9BURK|nr:MFS transporter [Corticibacter populi]RMX04145.1 MFS transporter [Corticibacter populi]RZS33158.1 putative MFS family arabinose efflux permease [Corticibacter populi]